ncbi:MAG TPA: rod shape-determining protein MreC [Candidatus Limnocylindria bacterium]|nr:rod shape-determining protein MreC [Candidatus Limnocylindria bacterium]
MFDFLRRNRFPLTLAALLVVAGGLVVSRSGDRVRNDTLGRLFIDGMAPIMRVATELAHTVGGVWNGITGVFRLRDQVRYLRRELREQKREVARLREVQLENERLRELLAFRPAVETEVITARVIGADALGLSRSLAIDRGTLDGVRKGAAVLAPEGVVGRVLLAGRHAARVLLITDHNSGIDSIVQRTRARGIVEGVLGGSCGLKFVKRTERLEVGDLVVTSGMDGIFPKGLPIGRIVAIDKRGQGLFQYATVEPTVDFAHLEEVLVVRASPARLPPAIPSP